MEIDKYIYKIKRLRACAEAVKDAHNYKTSQELWEDCKRGDWMLWLIGKSGSEKRRKCLVLSACKCARLVLPYVVKKGDLRPLKAIETAEQWANGENNITLEKVTAAAYAAADAYAAYATAYAAYAAEAGLDTSSPELILKIDGVLDHRDANHVEYGFRKENIECVEICEVKRI